MISLPGLNDAQLARDESLGQHISVELSEENWRALYVPERFAHGYQALKDNTLTSYHVGEFYTPNAEGGLLHDDPALGLKWPMPVSVISDKDRAFPPYGRIEQELRRRMSWTTPPFATNNSRDPEYSSHPGGISSPKAHT